MAKKIKTNKEKFEWRKGKVLANKHLRIYIDRHPDNVHFITAVYCKGCGTQIQGLSRDNVLVPYWNYSSTTIEFDNGSRHQTPMCIRCDHVTGKDDLEAMYMADLEALDREDDIKDKKIWDFYLDRIPEKIAKDIIKERKK